MSSATAAPLGLDEDGPGEANWGHLFSASACPPGPQQLTFHFLHSNCSTKWRRSQACPPDLSNSPGTCGYVLTSAHTCRSGSNQSRQAGQLCGHQGPWWLGGGPSLGGLTFTLVTRDPSAFLIQAIRSSVSFSDRRSPATGEQKGELGGRLHNSLPIGSQRQAPSTLPATGTTTEATRTLFI